MATFGERLKILRTEKEMTGEELGDIFNVTKTAISNWENGNRFPDEPVLIKLADYFNVSLDYLLGRVDQRTYKIYKQNIDGHDIEYSLDKNKYPDGLTYDEVIEVLEKFKEMGMDFSKFKKE